MDNIADMTIGSVAESAYIKLYRLNYKQNGQQKWWDIATSHDSVAILLHLLEKDSFIFVKQFRPAVYASLAKERDAVINGQVDMSKMPDASSGVTYELCAGIVDKGNSPLEAAKQEVLEECGFDVPADKLEQISVFRSSVGTSGSKMTLYYAQVTENMRVSAGGGVAEEGEIIETVEVPIKDSTQFIMDDTRSRPVSMMFAVMWFHQFKRTNLLSS